MKKIYKKILIVLTTFSILIGAIYYDDQYKTDALAITTSMLAWGGLALVGGLVGGIAIKKSVEKSGSLTTQQIFENYAKNTADHEAYHNAMYGPLKDKLQINKSNMQKTNDTVKGWWFEGADFYGLPSISVTYDEMGQATSYSVSSHGNVYGSADYMTNAIGYKFVTDLTMFGRKHFNDTWHGINDEITITNIGYTNGDTMRINMGNDGTMTGTNAIHMKGFQVEGKEGNFVDFNYRLFDSIGATELGTKKSAIGKEIMGLHLKGNATKDFAINSPHVITSTGIFIPMVFYRTTDDQNKPINPQVFTKEQTAGFGIASSLLIKDKNRLKPMALEQALNDFDRFGVYTPPKDLDKLLDATTEFESGAAVLDIADDPVIAPTLPIPFPLRPFPKKVPGSTFGQGSMQWLGDIAVWSGEVVQTGFVSVWNAITSIPTHITNAYTATTSAISSAATSVVSAVNSIATSIATAITSAMHSMFVPDATVVGNHWTGLVRDFEMKIPLFYDLFGVFGSIFKGLDNSKPNILIHLPKEWGGTQNVLPLDFMDPYMNYIRGVIGSFIWFTFIKNMIRKFNSVNEVAI